MFLIAKAKLIFLKIAIFVDKFISEGLPTTTLIEDILHSEEINAIRDEIDNKFTDFDRNEIFM